MTPKRGFNADERASEREAGPVVIGGITYHPARLTNKRMRQVRRMSREASEVTRQMARESTLFAETKKRAMDGGQDEKEAEAYAEDIAMADDDVSDAVNDSVAEQLSILLVDDDLKAPTKDRLLQHLDEDLDQRDVNALMGYLLGSEDPTEREATS
jgi:hypothetical protein